MRQNEELSSSSADAAVFSIRCPYDVLGIPSTATAEEIKAAYHFMARQYHPDKTKSSDNETFVQIQNAWECLNSSRRRQEYDQRLHIQQAQDRLRHGSSAIRLQMEDCHHIRDEDDGSDELILVHTCRCGCVLEVQGDEDDDDGDDSSFYEKYIVECPNCSLVYNTIDLEGQ